MTRLATLVDEARTCRVCVADLPHEPRPILAARKSARVAVIGQSGFDDALSGNVLLHAGELSLAELASGRGQVIDARRLASQKGWNPDVWFGHVEKAMLLLDKPAYHRRARHGYCRRTEPVTYVSRIQPKYHAYVALYPER